jgi:YidC/Oxa1 family membrane protein insertase
MEKRAIIAVVISIAFFYGYYLLFPPPQKEIPKQPAKQAATAAPGKTPSIKEVKEAAAQPLPQTSTAAAKDVVVDTDLYTAVFSTQGGSVKSFVLKKYKETNDIKGKQVALINETDPARYAMQTASTALQIAPSAVYGVSGGNLSVKNGEKRQLDFIYASPQGNTVKKSYIFHGGGYDIDLINEITNSGNEKISGNLQMIFPYQVEDKTKQSRFEISGPVTYAEDKLNTDTLKNLESKSKSYGKPQWTGFADKYFLSAVLSKDNSIDSVIIAKAANNIINSATFSPSFNIDPGHTYTVPYKLFFGPKDLDILKAQGDNLEKALDLGWFSAIAKPLLHILTFFYKYTHNYGIAIIIITVILKILFFPLTHKSYKSMKEMQKLQPMMLDLREKYKNDREALNRATMELYKTHKVNPLGGCFPMLVQIPVFFALYKALMFSIELRHAPFMLWITDLSAKDPYYVTPIIMGATMFIQQKMTPSTMDPTQAKMMLAMPIVFTFMFLNFPSGLVIYWLVNNVLTIAQQAYINSLLKE